MAQQFKLIGAEAIENLLKELPDRVARNVTTNAMRAGAQVVKKAAVAKLRSNPSVDTGTLAKAVAIKTAPKFRKATPTSSKYSRNIEDGTLVQVGIARIAVTAVPKGAKKPVKKSPNRYAHFVEFGTEHMPAEPFMRPAVDSSGGAAVTAIIQAAARGLARETAKLAAGKTSFVTGKKIG